MLSSSTGGEFFCEISLQRYGVSVFCSARVWFFGFLLCRSIFFSFMGRVFGFSALQTR